MTIINFRRSVRFVVVSLVVLQLLAFIGTLDVSRATSDSNGEHVTTTETYQNLLKPFQNLVFQRRRLLASSPDQAIAIEVPFKTICESCLSLFLNMMSL